jgi:hypothetical protein
MLVTRLSEIARRHCAKSKRGIVTSVAPRQRPPTMTMTMPMTWKNGATASATSPWPR